MDAYREMERRHELWLSGRTAHDHGPLDDDSFAALVARALTEAVGEIHPTELDVRPTIDLAACQRLKQS